MVLSTGNVYSYTKHDETVTQDTYVTTLRRLKFPCSDSDSQWSAAGFALPMLHRAVLDAACMFR